MAFYIILIKILCSLVSKISNNGNSNPITSGVIRVKEKSHVYGNQVIASEISGIPRIKLIKAKLCISEKEKAKNGTYFSKKKEKKLPFTYQT